MIDLISQPESRNALRSNKLSQRTMAKHIIYGAQWAPSAWIYFYYFIIVFVLFFFFFFYLYPFLNTTQVFFFPISVLRRCVESLESVAFKVRRIRVLNSGNSTWAHTKKTTACHSCSCSSNSNHNNSNCSQLWTKSISQIRAVAMQ